MSDVLTAPRVLFDIFSRAKSSWHCDMLDHLGTLRRMSHGNVLEIGVNRGCSTSALLLGVEENGGHLTSIDINPQCEELFYGHKQWTFICGDSANCIPNLYWDLVFIDGCHDYEAVKSDMRHITRVGLLHDIFSGFSGVRQAYDEWAGRKEIISELSYGLGAIYVD